MAHKIEFEIVDKKYSMRDNDLSETDTPLMAFCAYVISLAQEKNVELEYKNGLRDELLQTATADS